MNEINKYKTLTSKVILKNPWWEYKVDEYILPNGDKSEYHFVRTPGSCFIIPISVNNSFYMVRQFRYLNSKDSLEFPGGGIKDGVCAIDNAIMELEEEAGLIASELRQIGEFNPYNGVTSEICSVFIAKGLIETKAKPEVSEEIEIVMLTENEINNKIANGEIWDGMTLSAWSIYYFLKNKRGL